MLDFKNQWVVGFTDAEGCFHVGVYPNKSSKLGFQVNLDFSIVQHNRDINLLHAIKDFFGGGVVKPHSSNLNCCDYRVWRLDDLIQKIVPFFEKHQLKTMKRADFLKFRDVALLMKKKEHLTLEGLNEIREIISSQKSKNFKPKIESQWLVGFTDGDGCFYVGLKPSKTHKLRFQVVLEFSISQHQRDLKLLHAIKTFFGCGVVTSDRPNSNCYRFRVGKLDDLIEKIVPFFEKHPLQTIQNNRFLRFREVVLLMKKKVHLTAEGLEEIKKIISVESNPPHEKEAPGSESTKIEK